MSVIILFECVRQTIRLEALGKQSFYQSFMSSRKITILGTAASISNKLGSINTISRAGGNITGKEWEVDNLERKIISFVI